MHEVQKERTLGRTGVPVGRLGVATSYGAPARAFEEAFDRGVNYFYWGSRRTPAMASAIRSIAARGQRHRLFVVLQSYARSPDLLERVFLLRERGFFRFVGLSGHRRPLFAEVASDGAYDFFHLRYNAAHRGAEDEVFDRLPEGLGPGLVAFTATRWGTLLDPGKMPPGERPLGAADCYRFVLSHPAVDLCMTGPADLAQMREALAALDLGPLSPEEMERARRVGDHVRTHDRRPFAS